MTRPAVTDREPPTEFSPRPGQPLTLAEGLRLPSLVTVLLHPWVFLGLAMYGGAALVWLLVLSRIEVSLAYPFVGLGFLVTMVLAWLFLGETVSVPRIAGTLLIAAGIVVLART